MRSASLGTLFVLPAGLCAQTPARPLATVARDSATVRGTVRDAQGLAVVRAAILLTRPTDLRTQTQLSDSVGRFVFREVRGTGEFLLAVRAAAFRPVGRRLVLDAGQQVLEVAVVLTSLTDPTALEAVKVIAKREAPPPSTHASFGVRPGALEGLADGSRAGQSVVFTGPLDLARTSLLGTPDAHGLSVAGLGGRESQTELNGLLFRGAMLPGSLPKRVQVSAGTYDIASGGYSGGAVSLEIPPAGEFRTVRADIIASDGGPGARGAPTAQSRPFFAADWGGDWRPPSGHGGATFGVRVSRQSYETATLATVSDSALGALGVSAGVARAANSFIQQSLLANRPVAAPLQTGHLVTALVRIDPRIKPDAVNAFTVGVTHAVQPQGSWTPLSVLPGTRRERSSEFLMQWQRSNALQSRARWETRVGLSASDAASTPAAAGLADLRVTTVAARGDSTFGAPIRLGGAAGPTTRRRLLGELQLQRTAFAGSRGNHTIKLLGAGRVDHLAASQPLHAGALQFESLEALRALEPHSIEVTAQAPALAATVARASTGIGDDWRLSVGKRLQYGLRADLAWLDHAYAAGRRSPLIATLSPRIGFSWTIQPPKTGEGFATSTLFSRHLLPAGVLRVGAGVFHRDLTPDELLDVGSEQRVRVRRCVEPGALAATDVLLPATLEAACVASPNAVTETAETRVADRYAPPRSVRATASYTATWHGVELQSGAIFNHTSQQPQAVDRSVRDMPIRTLGGEGERPFYAPTAAISPTTGLVDRSLTTTTPGTRQVEVESSLSTRAMQGMLQLSPRWNDGGKALRLGYVWTRAQSMGSSWTTPAFGPIGVRQWMPNGRTPMHLVQVEAGRALRMVNVTAWVRAQSGLPYAPVVLGDVNGDGATGNDAAYVPSTSADSPALWQQLEAYMSTANPSARRCLAEARTSRPGAMRCRTPWALQSALSTTVELHDLGWRTEAVVSVQVENVAALAGALARIPPERGWGQPNAVNRALLRPVGFDAAANRFAYAVNPAFARRLGAGADGYRITLSARVPLSPPIQRQQVSRWLAARGVGSRLPVDSVARRFARNVPALYDAILELSDDLALQPDQLEVLAARRVRFDEHLQRGWDQMARRLTALPRDFDVDVATAVVQQSTDDAWEVSRLEAHAVRELFTPIQRALMPGSVRLLMQSETPIKQRIVFH